MNYSIPYRKDIDGLRAISVLSVLFYHYRIPGFGGGFVGVDIFFVISGYLIGGHVFDQIGAGRFSLFSFYERRIRRIFPALFVMLAATLFAALAIFYPPDLRALSVFAINVVLFLSNLRFYWDINSYTDAVARQTPLLHTWSLGVEEQFYICFPLIMTVIARFGGRYFQVLFALALFSLALCIVMARLEPSAAFFLLPYRFWEIALGALLAIKKIPAPSGPATRNILALCGIGLIVSSVVFFSERTLFPSEYALVPCCGALLVLYADCRTGWAGGLLGNQPVTRIGQWSYSLYLIHWPLLVMAQYYAFMPLSLFERLVLLIANIPLAALSWRYVEQPVRKRAFFPRRLWLFGAAAATTLTFVVGFYWIVSNDGLKGRFSPGARQLFANYTPQQLKCSGAFPNGDGYVSNCRLGEIGVPVRTLIWGDSHALALVPGAGDTFLRHHEAAFIVEKSGCPPLIGVEIDLFHLAFGASTIKWMNKLGLRDPPTCQNFNDRVLSWLKSNPPQTVLLVGRWAAYIDTSEKTPDDGSAKVLTDVERPSGNPQANEEVFERGMARTLAALIALHVQPILVESVPEFAVSVPYAIASTRRLNGVGRVVLPRKFYDDRQSRVRALFHRLAKRYSFKVIRPEDLLCNGAECVSEQQGHPLYMDSNHLSSWGSEAIASSLEPLLARSPGLGEH